MAMETKPKSVEWLASLDEGLARAKETGRVLLLDFFNPG
jgi:hypothetical protein